MKQGMQFPLLVHTKEDQPKDQTAKSAPSIGRLAEETHALIWNFQICIVNIFKDQLGLLLFFENVKKFFNEY